MKLFQESIYKFEQPDLSIINSKTDFGAGFYTTTDINQAKKWSKIKKKRLKENQVKRYINVYEYTPSDKLNVLKFVNASEEWLKFVYTNRQSDNLLHQYDIVEGPVADDNLYQVLILYENGTYNVDETIKRLKTYVLSNQISFHTKESLDTLKYIETIEVEDEDEF